MEKLIILIVTIIPIQLQSQYQSIFGENSTSWNVLQELGDAIDTDSLYIRADTTINGLTYKIIEGETLAESWYLRESNTKDSVLFLNPELSDSEFIVMDLTLEVADTFKLGPSLQDEFYVDSVYFYEGKKHIRFSEIIEIVGRSEHFLFIEGVGSNFGLFYQGIDLNYLHLRHYLLCAYQDGYIQYSNKSFDGECFIYLTKIEGTKQKGKLIDVHPNPANEYSIVTLIEDKFTEMDLSIYNSVGILIQKFRITSQQLNLDISDIPTGLYFFVFSDKGFYWTEKLLIK